MELDSLQPSPTQEREKPTCNLVNAGFNFLQVYPRVLGQLVAQMQNVLYLLGELLVLLLLVLSNFVKRVTSLAATAYFVELRALGHVRYDTIDIFLVLGQSPRRMNTIDE